MGAFDSRPNITIPDPDDPKAAEAFRKKWGWDAHEQIIMKGAFIAGDQEEIANAAAAADKKGRPTMKQGSGRLKMLEVMIVDWTLTQGGRKVEVTPHAIKRLPADYTTPLYEICDQLVLVMDEDEQDDFLDGASGPTKAS